jgi:geranylgeranylglycerol-phosphate geranylgeranyltransferase
MANLFLSYFKVFLDLIRVRNAVMSLFGVYLGASLIVLGVAVDSWAVFWAALSAMLILGGGNILNDYFDHGIDKVNKPHRPIPSGRISRSNALILSIVMFLVGISISKSINSVCLWIAGINTAILVLYAVYGKKIILVANLSISYLVASVFIYGAAAVHIPGTPLNLAGVRLVLILSVCSFLINLAREIVKDIEDMKGDRKECSRTLPIQFGADESMKVAFSSAVAAAILSYTPVFLVSDGFNELIYFIVVSFANIMIIYSFKGGKPAKTQKMLVCGMVLALAAFYMGLIHHFIGV